MMWVRFSYPAAALHSVRLSERVPCAMVSVSSVHNKLNHILPHRLQHAVVRERCVLPYSPSLSISQYFIFISIYEYPVGFSSSICAITLDA